MQIVLSFHHFDEVLHHVAAHQDQNLFVPRKTDILIFSGCRMVVLEVQVEYVADTTFIRVYLSSL